MTMLNPRENQTLNASQYFNNALNIFAVRNAFIPLAETDEGVLRVDFLLWDMERQV